MRSPINIRWSTVVAAALLACSGDSKISNPPMQAIEVGLSGSGYDLTALGAEATINGAKFISYAGTGSAGTGVYDAFVRVQKNGSEQGYNSSGRPLHYDENTSPTWTKDLRLDNVPLLNVGGVNYREFRLDVNQQNSSPLISLDAVKIWVKNQGGLTPTTYADFGTPAYDMDAGTDVYVELNYANHTGSGGDDMRLLVPSSVFGHESDCQYTQGNTPGCSTYVYLYSMFGNQGGVMATNDGYEEWSVAKLPYLTVSKTAVTTFDRTYPWTIAKAASPTALEMFRGDSGQVHYTVSLTKGSPVDANWSVSGTITINNPASQGSAQVSSVTDSVSGMTAPIAATCPGTAPWTIPSGGSLTCTYTRSLQDGSATTNTAFATMVGAGTYQGSASLTWGAPAHTLNDSVHVTDSFGGPWTFTATGAQSYNKTYHCDADNGTHTNIAAITETSAADTAEVPVTCRALTVTKTANTALRRAYHWEINKGRDALEPSDSITLSTGQTYDFGYKVVVDTAGFTDSNWSASGSVTVANPAGITARITALADTMSGTAVSLTCPSSFPATIAAHGSLVCTYTQSLSDATTRSNLATATLQNHWYPYGSSAANTSTTAFASTPVSVSFASPTITLVDAQVTVSDPFGGGTLGTVTVAQAPATFTYTHVISAFTTCGRYTVPNTASFLTNDTGAPGSSTYSVIVGVPCPGCNLTQGYWKTHNDSFHGGAPSDPDWGLIAATKEVTTFFVPPNEAGTTYFSVLWQAPQGNQFYVLAHQYIAAKLNILSGSNGSSVASTMTAAESFFSTYSATSWPPEMKTQLTSWASALDAFNNSNHCSEDRLSSKAP